MIKTNEDFRLVTSCQYKKLQINGSHYCCKLCTETHRKTKCEFKIKLGSTLVVLEDDEHSTMPPEDTKNSKIKALRSSLLRRYKDKISNLTNEERDKLDIDIIRVNKKNCSFFLLNKDCIFGSGEECA